MSKLRRAASLALMVLIVPGCGGPESTVIVGKVQSLSGKPLAGVALAVGLESGSLRPSIASTVTDANGCYELSFHSEVQQTLMISAREDGFKPWRAVITSGGGSILIVNLADAVDSRDSTCEIRSATPKQQSEFSCSKTAPR